MLDYIIILDDLEPVLHGLGTAERIVAEETKAALVPVLNDMAGRAADYPPERPGQRYERTDDLGKGWTGVEPQIALQADELTARLVNPVPYNQWVQDPEDQAALHEGRWQTTDQVQEAFESEAEAAAERAANAAAARIERGG